MVKNEKQHIEKTRGKQGCAADRPEPYKIAASTPFDFGAKNLTPYGGLFPVATLLEKLGLKKLVEETLTIRRIPRVMTIYQFLLGMVLAIYIGFFPAEPSSFRGPRPDADRSLAGGELRRSAPSGVFLTSMPVTVAQQLLKLQRLLRERVWDAANVHLPTITVDTDTTVHTLYGQQMGARKSYNRRTEGGRATSRFSPLSPRPGNISAGSCATETGPRVRRSRVIWRPCLPPCPGACAKFSRGPMLAFIVQKLCKRMRSRRLPSSSWRARPHVCSKS